MSLYFNGGSISAGSGGGSDDTYTKAEINGLLSAKSNTGLDNLNASGQMVIDSQNGTISNCILEIPQNIKVELSNNTLTLKAGSVLTRTGSTYSTYTLANDETYNIPSSTDGKYIPVTRYNTGAIIEFVNINKFSSGSSLPETGNNGDYFFNTTDKKIYIYGNNNWIESVITYPICLIEMKSGVASFAKDSKGRDMIFNGACFIGHHAVVYPNVKGLIPNGFNDDGSLASILRTNDSLRIFELSSACNSLTMSNYSARFALRNVAGEVDNLFEITGSNIHYYVKSLNLDYYKSSGSYHTEPLTLFINYAYDGTTVTDFTIRQPYEGSRNLLTDDIEEEVATKQVDVTTLTGYDSTQTQTLKNINGVLTWVTD